MAVILKMYLTEHPVYLVCSQPGSLIISLHWIVKKTNYVVFSRSKTASVPNSLVFNSASVSKVDSVRFLGFILDETLSWAEHVNFVKTKVSKGLGMLKLCCNFLPRSCLSSIYYAHIFPYLSSGIEFWGYSCQSYTNVLLVLQKKCIRIICHVDNRTHCAPLAKQLNILLFNDLRYFNTLVLMYRVYNALCCPVVANLFCRVSNVHSVCTRVCKINFYMPTCSTNVRRNFITNVGVGLWNALTIASRESSTLSIFKSVLRNDMFSAYL